MSQDLGLAIFLAAMVGVEVFFRYVWFYREGALRIEDNALVCSPVCGKVVMTRNFWNGLAIYGKGGLDDHELADEIKSFGDGMVVGIYLSPMDSHFVYAPVDGIVDSIEKIRGLSHSMMGALEGVLFYAFGWMVGEWDGKRHLENNRTVFRIRGKDFWVELF